MPASKAQKAKAAAENSATIPLFEQGVIASRGITSHSFEALTKLDQPTVPDLTRPFILHKDEWCSSAKQEQSDLRVALDEFTASFDVVRAQQRGARASKTVGLDRAKTPFDFGGEAQKLFKGSSQGIISEHQLPDAVKQQVVLSMFGMDQAYDKVASESAGVACVRLNLSGTRRVIVADSLQLLGYMQRKGVEGLITTARMGSFFRSMGPGTITDFTSSCTLESGTVGPGDLLFIPAGAIIAELCHSCNIGLRWPVFVHGSASPNISLSFQRRRDELEKSARATDRVATKTAIEQEMAVLDGLIEAAKANPPTLSLPGLTSGDAHGGDKKPSEAPAAAAAAGDGAKGAETPAH